MRSQMRRGSSYSYRRYQEPVPLAIRAGSLAALIGVFLCAAGPIGYRFGLLSLPLAADRVLIWGATLAGAGAVLAALGLVAALRRHHEARRGIGRAIVTIVVGAALFAAGGRLPGTAASPPIADVTTDTENPPDYVTLLQLRGADAAPAAYAGEVVASRQRTAYPDIQPLLLPVPRDQAFAQALTAVRELGWTLVAADGSTGRIEASVVARFFGTTDDIVIRVTAASGGSRVDVRSTSRDLPGRAATARHVRAVLEALRPSS